MLANSSSSAGDLTARAVTPRSSRLAIPVRVPAGGNSTIAVTFCSRSVSVHRSQRTGWVNWATSVSIAAVAAVGQQRGGGLGGRDDGRRGSVGVKCRRHVLGVERSGHAEGAHPGLGRRV